MKQSTLRLELGETFVTVRLLKLLRELFKLRLSGQLSERDCSVCLI